MSYNLHQLSQGRISEADIINHQTGPADRAHSAFDLIFDDVCHLLASQYDYCKPVGTRCLTQYIDESFFKIGISFFVYDMHIGFLWEDDTLYIAHIELLPEDEEAAITDLDPYTIEIVEGLTDLYSFKAAVAAHLSQY